MSAQILAEIRGMAFKHHAAGAQVTPGVEGGRRFRLKAATQAAHDRLEAVVQGGGMFGSLHGYRAYLQGTLIARGQVEVELNGNAAERILPSWPRRRLASLIAADLADLGAEAPGATSARKVSPLKLSDGELLGRLYVLEGSALGARILTRLVEGLGLSSAFGARHLHAQAGDVRAWTEFCRVLEAARLSAVQEAQVLTSASHVFDRFADAYATAHG